MAGFPIRLSFDAARLAMHARAISSHCFLVATLMLGSCALYRFGDPVEHTTENPLNGVQAEDVTAVRFGCWDAVYLGCSCGEASCPATAIKPLRIERVYGEVLSKADTSEFAAKVAGLQHDPSVTSSGALGPEAVQVLFVGRRTEKLAKLVVFEPPTVPDAKPDWTKCHLALLTNDFEDRRKVKRIWVDNKSVCQLTLDMHRKWCGDQHMGNDKELERLLEEYRKKAEQLAEPETKSGPPTHSPHPRPRTRSGSGVK